MSFSKMFKKDKSIDDYLKKLETHVERVGEVILKYNKLQGESKTKQPEKLAIASALPILNNEIKLLNQSITAIKRAKEGKLGPKFEISYLVVNAQIARMDKESKLTGPLGKEVNNLKTKTNKYIGGLEEHHAYKHIVEGMKAGDEAAVVSYLENMEIRRSMDTKAKPIAEVKGLDTLDEKIAARISLTEENLQQLPLEFKGHPEQLESITIGLKAELYVLNSLAAGLSKVLDRDQFVSQHIELESPAKELCKAYADVVTTTAPGQELYLTKPMSPEVVKLLAEFKSKCDNRLLFETAKTELREYMPARIEQIKPRQ